MATDDADARYGDEEAALIIRRAAELQQREPSGSAEHGGLSIADLEEIAVEAGIDRRHIRQAAAEIARGEADAHVRFIGAPLTITIERWIDGEVPADAFEPMVPEIESAVGGLGQASTLGHSFTWTLRTDERSVHVSVHAVDGRTRIRIEERLRQFAGELFGGLVGGFGAGAGLGVGLGVGIGALGSVLFSVGVPVLALGGSYYAARKIFRSVARSRRRRLEDLADTLVRQAEAAGGGPQAIPRGGTASDAG